MANTKRPHDLNGYSSDWYSIRMSVAGSGWLDFNTTTSWSSPAEVGGNNPSESDYDKVSHPYAHPATDGSDDFVMLLAQNQGSSGHKHVVWARSTDDEGDDFDLTCANCCEGTLASECGWASAESSGTAGVAICVGGGSCQDYASALHGRWMWDYVADPVIDLSTDEPTILFTGKPDGTTCAAVGTALPDIYRADWDAGSQEWVVYDGPDTGTCPDALIIDAHDPAITPLPGGQFKVYVVDSSHDVIAWYWDGSAFETETSSPKFEWSGAIEVGHTCIANMATVLDPSDDEQEGMFFVVAVHNEVFETFTCDGGASSGNKGLRFAERQN